MAQDDVLTKMIQQILAFRNERNWKQFHNPKDTAIALSLEASELLEHFLWKNEKELQEHIQKKKGAIADELSDVLYWVLLMSHDLQIDLPSAFQKKMKKNAKKYPIKKVLGKHKKYTEY